MLYVASLILFALALPPSTWDPGAAEFIFIIGAIGIWRYSWSFLHLVRSIIYRKLVFPRWRSQIDQMGEAGMPSHVYLLVTSFRIDAEITRRVYQSVIDEAIGCKLPTTIVASVVELGDQRLIKRLFELANPPEHVRLKLVRIAGTGKRDALAYAFRAVAAESPGPDDVAAVIDGDSILEPNLVRRCAPFFKLNPRAGALTTDEVCEVEGNRLFCHWYPMRFAQRQILMCSTGLARRVLTLTGRMSMFRAVVLADPDFIRRVEADWTDHWRLGRIRFLTGDDKSSWFELLKEGWEMLYIPDVKVLTVEEAPSGNFFEGSIVLMRRWFGNMLRTNSRAIALGPWSIGFFTWWCIVDQRISMWTSLVGLTLALLGSLFVSAQAIALYLMWIMLTRYVVTLSLLTVRPSVSPLWPFLIFYNQIVGSIVKIFMVHHLDRQKWTRQKTTLGQKTGGAYASVIAASSDVTMIVSFLFFISVLVLISGVIALPSFG